MNVELAAANLLIYCSMIDPTNYPSHLLEYVWPCGRHENVSIEEAPGVTLVRGQLTLPVAKQPEDFTEEERIGIPGRRKCCQCWATCSLFKRLDACEECEHPFNGCSTCLIVDSSGCREIATIEGRVVGEFDQTPEFWRCNECENLNSFGNEGPFNGFLAPKFADYLDETRCQNCQTRFSEDHWVISPFWIYLGTWNGRVVAKGGPWHWSLEWHRNFAPADHSKENCYSTRKNGRKRRENPCIAKEGLSKPHVEKKSFVIPTLVVQTDDNVSLPPLSSGLTPYAVDDHDRPGPKERLGPPSFEGHMLTIDNQTSNSAVFTIADYQDEDPEGQSIYGQEKDRLQIPEDDHQTVDIGSYYDAHSVYDQQSEERDCKEGDGSGEEWFVDHTHYTVVHNIYAVLATDAAAPFNPPGMTHDMLWDERDEDDDVPFSSKTNCEESAEKSEAEIEATLPEGQGQELDPAAILEEEFFNVQLGEKDADECLEEVNPDGCGTERNIHEEQFNEEAERDMEQDEGLTGDPGDMFDDGEGEEEIVLENEGFINNDQIADYNPGQNACNGNPAEEDVIELEPLYEMQSNDSIGETLPEGEKNLLEGEEIPDVEVEPLMNELAEQIEELLQPELAEDELLEHEDVDRGVDSAQVEEQDLSENGELMEDGLLLEEEVFDEGSPGERGILDEELPREEEIFGEVPTGQGEFVGQEVIEEEGEVIYDAPLEENEGVGEELPQDEQVLDAASPEEGEIVDEEAPLEEQVPGDDNFDGEEIIGEEVSQERGLTGEEFPQEDFLEEGVPEEGSPREVEYLDENDVPADIFPDDGFAEERKMREEPLLEEEQIVDRDLPEEGNVTNMDEIWDRNMGHLAARPEEGIIQAEPALVEQDGLEPYKPLEDDAVVDNTSSPQNETWLERKPLPDTRVLEEDVFTLCEPNMEGEGSNGCDPPVDNETHREGELMGRLDDEFIAEDEIASDEERAHHDEAPLEGGISHVDEAISEGESSFPVDARAGPQGDVLPKLDESTQEVAFPANEASPNALTAPGFEEDVESEGESAAKDSPEEVCPTNRAEQSAEDEGKPKPEASLPGDSDINEAGPSYEDEAPNENEGIQGRESPVVTDPEFDNFYTEFSEGRGSEGEFPHSQRRGAELYEEYKTDDLIDGHTEEETGGVVDFEQARADSLPTADEQFERAENCDDQSLPSDDAVRIDDLAQQDLPSCDEDTSIDSMPGDFELFVEEPGSLDRWPEQRKRMVKEQFKCIQPIEKEEPPTDDPPAEEVADVEQKPHPSMDVDFDDPVAENPPFNQSLILSEGPNLCWPDQGSPIPEERPNQLEGSDGLALADHGSEGFFYKHAEGEETFDDEPELMCPSDDGASGRVGRREEASLDESYEEEANARMESPSQGLREDPPDEHSSSCDRYVPPSPTGVAETALEAPDVGEVGICEEIAPDNVPLEVNFDRESHLNNPHNESGNEYLPYDEIAGSGDKLPPLLKDRPREWCLRRQSEQQSKEPLLMERFEEGSTTSEEYHDGDSDHGPLELGILADERSNWEPDSSLDNDRGSEERPITPQSLTPQVPANEDKSRLEDEPFEDNHLDDRQPTDFEKNFFNGRRHSTFGENDEQSGSENSLSKLSVNELDSAQYSYPEDSQLHQDQQNWIGQKRGRFNTKTADSPTDPHTYQGLFHPHPGVRVSEMQFDTQSPSGRSFDHDDQSDVDHEGENRQDVQAEDDASDAGGDTLPEFPTPQHCRLSRDNQIPSPAPLSTKEPRLYHPRYERAHDMYYDPDDIRSDLPETPCHHDVWPDAAVPYPRHQPHVEEQPKPRHNNEVKDNRYSWLLPLMAIATLGWGMGNLEQQYRVGVRKEPRCSIRALVSELLGGKKRKGNVDTVLSCVQMDETIARETKAQTQKVRTCSSGSRQGLSNGLLLRNDDKRRRGFWSILLGRKKVKQSDLEAQTHPLIGEQLAPNNETPQYLSPVNHAPTWDQSHGCPNEPLGNGRTKRDPVGVVSSQEEATDGTCFDRSRRRKKAEQGGFLARLFGCPRKSRDPIDDLGSAEDKSIAEQFPDVEIDNKTSGTERRGFFARLFGWKSRVQNSDEPLMKNDGRNERTTGNSDLLNRECESHPKKGFFARLFYLRRTSRRTPVSEDIELGNIASSHSDLPRPGRVKTGSPQLVQRKDSRQSTIATLVDEYNAEQRWRQLLQEESLGKHKDKNTSAKSSRGKRTVKGKAQEDKRRSKIKSAQVLENNLPKPKPARRETGKGVRYAVVDHCVLEKHIPAPKPKKRGPARMAVAAVNPGNWFWMDVYWG